MCLPKNFWTIILAIQKTASSSWQMSPKLANFLLLLAQDSYLLLAWDHDFKVVCLDVWMFVSSSQAPLCSTQGSKLLWQPIFHNFVSAEKVFNSF